MTTASASNLLTPYRPRILVVDDIPTNVTMLCSALSEQYEVHFATSAQKALALARLRKPDLLLLDVMMPQMSGHEMHAQLRRDALLKDIPVMFVTADTSTESALKGLALGADDYIAKPFVIPIVLAKVRNLLTRSRTQKELELALTGAKQGLWDWIVDTPAVHFNTHWALPLGYVVGEMQPCTMPWENIVHHQDIKSFQTSLRRYLERESTHFEPEVRMRHRTGEYVWMQLFGSATESDLHQRPLRLMGTYMNISRRKEAEQALRNNERKLSMMLASMQNAVLVIDDQGIITLNHIPACSPLHGNVKPSVGQHFREALPSPFHSFLWGALYHRLNGHDNRNHEIEISIDKQTFCLQVNLNPISAEDECSTGILVVIQDCSARRAAENEIRSLAFFDPLTKLPNRRLLRDHLRQSLNASERSGNMGALLFIDLDKFKQLNDTLGHDQGDQLLVEVAQRLSHTVRCTDSIARFGGDEFVVLLEDFGTKPTEAAREVKAIAEKIMSALCRNYMLGETPYQLTASIGICMFQGRLESEENLMKYADLAMYNAKGAGRGKIMFFDRNMEIAVTQHVNLVQKLQRSISEDQFFLVYQPQVSAQKKLLGVEALTRWPASGQRESMPANIISTAEESGLIIPLGDKVLEKACRQLAIWQKTASFSQLTVSVNISPLQFMQDDFVNCVELIVLRSGIKPSGLKLEITETLLLNDFAIVIQRMQKLAELGIRFSLDDFGTGYSSLTYLKQLPLEQIKIDRSFVANIPGNPIDGAIVRAIIGLGKSLNMSIVAEGVETIEQVNFLASEGCNQFQGYYFGKPMMPMEIEHHWKPTSS